MSEAAADCPPEPKPESPQTEPEATIEEKPPKPLNMSPGAVKLRSWLNKTLRIEMFDGRILIGIFLCTDRDSNVILGSCTEHLPTEGEAEPEEPRMLGLVMIPGKHIKNISIDENSLDPAKVTLEEEVREEEIT